MKVGLLVDITENYEDKIRHAKGLGFDFGQLVIWDMDFYTEENLAALKKLLSEIDFTVTDLWCGWSPPVIWKYPHKYTTLGLVPKEYRAKRLEDLRRGAKFAYGLGVKNIITHTGFIPDDPAAEAHVGVVECLKDLCSELDERGQTFSFETGEDGITRIRTTTQGKTSKSHLFDITVSSGEIQLTENGVSFYDIYK